MSAQGCQRTTLDDQFNRGNCLMAFRRSGVRVPLALTANEINGYAEPGKTAAKNVRTVSALGLSNQPAVAPPGGSRQAWRGGRPRSHTVRRCAAGLPRPSATAWRHGCRELPSGMVQQKAAAGLIAGLADQAAKPSIAVNLQQAAEALQMICGCCALRSSL